MLSCGATLLGEIHPLITCCHTLTLITESHPVSHTRHCLSVRPRKPIRFRFLCRNPTACGSLERNLPESTHTSSSVLLIISPLFRFVNSFFVIFSKFDHPLYSGKFFSFSAPNTAVNPRKFLFQRRRIMNCNGSVIIHIFLTICLIFRIIIYKMIIVRISVRCSVMSKYQKAA